LHCNILCHGVIAFQNAQAIIDLNTAVQDQDKSIAAKDARYALTSVCEMLSGLCHLQPLQMLFLRATAASAVARLSRRKKRIVT